MIDILLVIFAIVLVQIVLGAICGKFIKFGTQ